MGSIAEARRLRRRREPRRVTMVPGRGRLVHPVVLGLWIAALLVAQGSSQDAYELGQEDEVVPALVASSSKTAQGENPAVRTVRARSNTACASTTFLMEQCII